MPLVRIKAMAISDGVEAQRSMCQIWNPLDSGGVIRVTKIGIAFTAWKPGSIPGPRFYDPFAADIRSHDLPLSTLRGPVHDEDGNNLPYEARVANCLPADIPGHIEYEHWARGFPNNQNGGADGFAPTYDVVPLDTRDLNEGVRLSPGQGLTVVTAKPDDSTEPRIWLICNFHGYVE